MSLNSKKKLNVLMVNHEFPPIGGGGGTTTRFLAKYLARLGVEVSIVTAKPGKEDFFFHPDGFKLYYVGPTKTNIETSHIPEMTRFIIASLFKSRRIIKEIKPDLIHSFFTIPAGCFGLYSKKIFGIPYITSTLGADVPGFNIGDWRLNVYHSITKSFSRSIWKNSSFVIANSESLKESCNKFMPNLNIGVITNGVDSEIFYPDLSRKINKNNCVQLLFISRLSSQKGVESLIKACGILKKKNIENYKLTIVGDGPLKDKMFSLVNEYAIKDKINFLGWRKLEDLPDIYRSSDVFILPSVMEGMPSVVLQAMACGLPVIGTKVEGFQEVLEDNVNGLTVAYNDTENLSNAIKKLIDSPELRKKMSDMSIKKSKQFLWESIAKKYLELYKETIFRKIESIEMKLEREVALR